ncbi:DUF3137 domain-containing protein [Paenibacillus sp. IB182496]|uniref:DUF3137 domain-containing protein n=1 Tax=Paenibacillus sabuli TaxID=2772509 RepID=A0A927BRP1_9BACL|nr:DUF3137 domain-containing protein [Paenibacillus sabuli]MBD2845531.1 DUF3137 domain-containing protein [Paenibacillus sabuli]
MEKEGKWMLPSYEDVIRGISVGEAWQQLRRHRNKALVLRSLSWILGAVIFVVGVCILVLVVQDGEWDDSEGQGAALVFGVVVIICSFIYMRYASRRIIKSYSRHYKRLIVPPLVANMIEQASYEGDAGARFICHYEAEGGIPLEELLKVPLFDYLQAATKYTSEDLFAGTLGETDFKLAELHAQEVEETEDGNTTSTVFEGLIFMADFHKHFAGTTTIASRKGRIGYPPSLSGSKMNTVSHEFDQHYRLRTTNETTSRYLLPVDMLERLVRLREQFPKKGIHLCLHEGMLVIAIHRVDFFEVKGLRRLGEDAIMKTYQEFRSILDIVDLLNLNTRIWSK